jgi:hypothetical protein
MKKYQIFILMLLISGSNLFSQESGWEVSGRIKNQKKKLINLVDVCVSPDSNFIYTVNHNVSDKGVRNTLIHKWDYNSGEYIDSLTTPQKLPVKFSSDGKYLLLISNSFILADTFQTDIYIYDLLNQKITNQIPFSTPGNIGFKNGTVYMYHSNVVFDKFDYDDYREHLYLSAFIFAYTYQGTGTSGVTSYYFLGGSGLFKIEKDSLNLLHQYSNDRTFSKINVNNTDYISSTLAQSSASSTGSAYSTQKKYTNFIKSFSNNSFNTLSKVDYEFNEDYGTGVPYHSWSKGDSNTFRYLGYNKDKNDIISTYGNKLLYFDVNNWNSTRTYTTENPFNLASFCNEGRYILNIVRDSLIIINVTNKFVDEIIKLPFIPQKIKLLKNDAKLLVFNDFGYVAMVELPQCFNIKSTKEPVLDNKKLINQYNSDYMELNPQKVLELKGSKIDIFDILGRNILSINIENLKNNPNIDISNLKPGIYFIKSNNIVEKFMKM